VPGRSQFTSLRSIGLGSRGFEAEIDPTYMGGIERGKRNPSLLVMAWDDVVSPCAVL
jgi:hypothetical protein